ncbi:EboA domain-containing protein [Chitinophagaceae bacterium LB-8]|uniref:EboA domain-containing protein n=1 Tax=Paraflavisolibacter caeni TaxID=2982496 RepID=A0A9X2XWI4_9BACT|nr:EboA domain-containing protein [Paraflavisolibacter caeni]MCU7549942.1 EboA domain-containing protein [Paraflavisolibacter caeni]
MYSAFLENQVPTAYGYDAERLKGLLSAVIVQNVQPGVWDWLQEKAGTTASVGQFNTAFVLIPRKTGKAVIQLTEEQNQNIQSTRKGFSIKGWTIDRLARVWLVLQLDTSDQDRYFRMIENLFLAAEMNELVALYSALPVLAYPELWKARCSEGIRSNIGDVLLAIICNNPYPSEYLSDAAWNQLVMKAFFTEKPIRQIYGLDQRANQELAKILTDYAHERWAAHRPIHPQLWRCVGKFINEDNFNDIKRVAGSADETEQKAALLACHDSDFLLAKELLEQHPEEKAAIEGGVLTWEGIE